MSQVLYTEEDLQWLRETHLRGVELPDKYKNFKFAVMHGNSDAPDYLELFATAAPATTEDYLCVRLNISETVHCEYIEMNGSTPKWHRVLESQRGALDTASPVGHNSGFQP